MIIDRIIDSLGVYGLIQMGSEKNTFDWYLVYVYVRVIFPFTTLYTHTIYSPNTQKSLAQNLGPNCSATINVYTIGIDRTDTQ